MAANGDFEWDDGKAAGNLALHDMSFDEAIAVFADPSVVEVDVTRSQDSETRTKAIGAIGGHIFTVVFTMRGEVTRLISARRANDQEERAYGYRPPWT